MHLLQVLQQAKQAKQESFEKIERMNLSEDTILEILNAENETLNASTSEVSEAPSAEALITEFVFEV